MDYEVKLLNINGGIMETQKKLNKVYEVLHSETNNISKHLHDLDLTFKVGYYPFHSFKYNEEFFIEKYPIPVITVENEIDIGVDIHQVFFEIKLSRETALKFDFQILSSHIFEVYGVDDYLNDFHKDNINEITQNIKNSSEKEIGVTVISNKNNLLEETKSIISLLRSIKNF